MENNKRTLIIMIVGALVIAGTLLFQQFFGGDEAPPQAAQEERAPAARRGRASEPVQTPAQRRALLRTASIRTGSYEAVINNLGGGIERFRLLGDERFQRDGRPLDLINTPSASAELDRIFRCPPNSHCNGQSFGYDSMRTHFARLGVPDDAVWELEQLSPTRVRLTWHDEGLRIERTFSAGRGPYQVWQTVRVTNTGPVERRTRLEVAVSRYVRRESEKGGALDFLPGGGRSPEISHGVCIYDDEIERVDRGALAPEDEPTVPHGYGAGRSGTNVKVAGVESSYFVQALAATNRQHASRCALRAVNLGDSGAIQGTLFESRLVYPWETIAAGRSRTWRTLGYFGPKDREVLHLAGHELSTVVDLGFFSIIAGALAEFLGMIYGVLPEPMRNWGLAIILLTLLVRLALFPLTNLSFKSMARMRKLKPEIDRINELYKDDAEKKGAAVMELYRKHKINPLSGCLPMLLQLPIWWALYTSLSTNVQLYHMPFALWWQDLSGPDPFFVLPLALGVLMHIQQRLTPTTMDPMQAKMMLWFMPIMITAFMLFLPAGLCLYMFTNSALGIAQQKFNEWRLSKQDGPQTTVVPSSDAAPEEDDGDDEDETSTNEPKRPKRKRLRRARRGRA
jgi:YidC/Oxa1 family membrane protein insertase